MIQLNLSDDEVRVLVEVLEGVHSDLRMEIADTDRKDFRDMLKSRKEVIAKAIDGLQGTAGGA